jgi:hypothetical protein
MYDGYDNYGYLPARKWAGIKRLIDQVAGKYPAFRHLWRTNDAELVRQFIELLENPE